MANLSSYSIHPFWVKSAGSKHRSRFNLLLLEHNEYYFEDFSVYYLPNIPEWTSKQSVEYYSNLKIQGRLKLCSRSIIFEPSDIKKPLLKFPFKYIQSSFKQITSKIMNNSEVLDSIFTFSFSSFITMKENDKIGPYNQIDCKNYLNNNNENELPSERTIENIYQGNACFVLIHSDIISFLSKIEQLRHVYHAMESSNYKLADSILKPILTKFSSVSFDTSALIDFHEDFLLKEPINTKLIKPLVSYPGIIMITRLRLYFQPAPLNDIGNSIKYIEFSSVKRIYQRRYLLRQIGLEFILKDGLSYLFIFDNKDYRDGVYDIINKNINLPNDLALENIIKLWQMKKISNFDYLMYLNMEADRSLNDLTQYPVFPQVIADYVSSTLNLESEQTFRDLSKPMGALNPQRLQYFQERYRSMPPEDKSLGLPPPFLYGTHYSTPAYVLYYLVRVAPEYMLCLQNGKFDATDRMFISLADNWQSCLTNPADLKELIPEFYSLTISNNTNNGEFLLNKDDLDLGYRQNGMKLHDVELPPWAKSTKDFIKKCNKALESDYVSNHLHEWIDLIFGYKQQGIEAIKANNLFYYLTYENAVDIDNVTDSHERHAIEIQIQEFGQTPKQLFNGPHPKRNRSNDPIFLIDKTTISINKIEIINQLEKEINVQKDILPSDSYEDNIQVISLGDDFKAEVDKELNHNIRNSQPSSSISSNSSSTKSNTMTSYFTDFAMKTASITDKTLGTKLLPRLNSLSLSNSNNSTNEVQPIPNKQTTTNNDTNRPLSSQLENKQVTKSSYKDINKIVDNNSTFNQINIDWTKFHILPTYPFISHQSIITDVSVSVDPDHKSGDIKKIGKITVCCSGYDGNCKILDVDVSSAKGYSISSKRSYKCSDISLSSCYLFKDSKIAFNCSWDNKLYSYSIVNAKLLDSQTLHDDSVTCLSVDFEEKYLLTGSRDGTVKLWTIKNNVIRSTPTSEFYDHENPVRCVALNEEGNYAVAGAEDGKVIAWDINTGLETLSYQVSKSGKGITCVEWLPKSSNSYNANTFTDDKIICCSQDCCMLCLDTSNRLYAATTTLDKAVLCIASDGYIIYGGCDDGSIRLWIMENGRFKEVYRYPNAHDDKVTAITLNKQFNILVSGGFTGTIRVWRILFN